MVKPDGFDVYQRERQTGSVRFADIVEITLYKRKEIIGDLICCDVATRAVTWFLHEDALGFDDLMLAFDRLPGFHREWRSVIVEPASPANRMVVYRRGFAPAVRARSPRPPG